MQSQSSPNPEKAGAVVHVPQASFGFSFAPGGYLCQTTSYCLFRGAMLPAPPETFESVDEKTHIQLVTLQLASHGAIAGH